MKKTLKISGIIGILAILALCCFGCSKEIEMVRPSTAEEAINLFNQYNTENNIKEMVKLYSNEYIDYVGYDASKIIKVIEKNRKNLEIKSSVVKNIEDINEKVKKATVTITSIVDDKEISDDYIYAIISEDNGWAISPDGIIECKNFNVPMSTKGELNLNLIKEAVLFDGSLIRVNVFNDSKKEYVFGTEENKSEIIVKTTEGTFKTTIEEPQKIAKNVRSYFIAKLENLKGDIETVSVTSVYELDKDENVLTDTNREIIIYRK